MIKCGANVNFSQLQDNNKRNTPLFAAVVAFDSASSSMTNSSSKFLSPTLFGVENSAPRRQTITPTSFLSVIRLLLLYGANPLEPNAEDESSAFDRAKDGAKREMELYLENPTRYCADWSALIALSIGLASLDLPTLVVTLIAEYLAWLNEEKLFGEYSEQKSWDIAALIKKKAQNEN